MTNFTRNCLKTIAVIFLLSQCNTISFSDSVLPPTSYIKISKDQEIVFVMIFRSTPKGQGIVDVCEGGYQQSGLYRAKGSKKPLWTVDWYGDVEISSNGDYLVREGSLASSSKDEAVAFFYKGKLLKSYKIEDLVKRHWSLPRSVSYLHWVDPIRVFFNEIDETYTVTTLHGEKYTFSIKNGNIISFSQLGLLNKSRWKYYRTKSNTSWVEKTLNCTQRPDTDLDGVLDENDAFPVDPNEWKDANQNRIGDNADSMTARAKERTDKEFYEQSQDDGVSGDGTLSSIDSQMHGQSQKGNRFIESGNGIVTDQMTGLMWAKQPPTTLLSYQEAQNYCREFHSLGFNDWRLPMIEELKNITDQSQKDPALPLNSPFSGIKSHFPYWSSTEHKFGPKYVWGMSFWYGKAMQLKKQSKAFVWPVRSTQAQE